MKRLALIVTLLTLVAAACAPVANVARTFSENPDGAEVAMLTDGIGVHPGPEVAEGSIVIIIGDTLDLVAQPTQGECEFMRELVVRCDLGDLAEPVVLYIEGINRFASLSFRRPGSSSVYHAIGQ